MERIYLDTCVWCRPFDKPTQRIAKEAKALPKILSLADEARIKIIGSGIILFEASMIDVAEKRDAVFALIHKSVATFAETTEEVERLAVELMNKCGLDSMDAAHITTAIGKRDCVSKFGIIVKNPADYIKVMQDE